MMVLTVPFMQHYPAYILKKSIWICVIGVLAEFCNISTSLESKWVQK